jgi:hypothetical protein
MLPKRKRLEKFAHYRKAHRYLESTQPQRKLFSLAASDHQRVRENCPPLARLGAIIQPDRVPAQGLPETLMAVSGSERLEAGKSVRTENRMLSPAGHATLPADLTAGLDRKSAVVGGISSGFGRNGGQDFGLAARSEASSWRLVTRDFTLTRRGPDPRKVFVLPIFGAAYVSYRTDAR